MGNDAEVIIKISGDTKNFDSKYMELVKKYKNKEVDLGITANDLGKEEQVLSRMNREAEKLDQKYGEINQKIKDQEATLERIKNIPRDYTTEEGRIQNIQLENEYNRINRQVERQKHLSYETLQEIIKQGEQIDTQQSKVDKLNAKYEKQKNDLSVIGQKIKETGSVDLGAKMDGVGKSVNQTIKKVAKWGLAIFGVRSAYLGIRRIMSSVLSQNAELGSQMSAIGKSFAGAFEPIVKRIINLLKTLMGYVNTIWQKLFGKDLFKATSKSAEKTAGAAKEINKQLAGFDEANVLNSNTSSGAGGGTTSDDFNIPIKKLPDWLDNFIDWCKKNPKLAGILFGTIPFVLLGLGKLGGALTEKAIGKILGKAGSAATGTGGSGLLGLCTALAWVAGLTTLAVEIVVLYKVGKETWEEGKKMVGDAKEAHENADQVIEASAKVRKDNVKTLTQLDENDTKRKNIIETTKQMIKSDLDFATGSNNNWAEQAHMLGVTTHGLYDTAEAFDEAYRSGKLTEDEEYEYYKMLKNELNPTLDKTTGWVYKHTDENKKLKRSFADLDTKYSTKYTIEMSETGSNKLIQAANRVRDSLSNIGDKWKSVAEKMAGSLGITVKKNALGGIVNLPGRGVPLNVAGEAGREGIVPMDNESQMQLLGQSIAKYVNINNVVNNYMDARKINSILQASANNERLANNG